jgi:hypothetical protein
MCGLASRQWKCPAKCPILTIVVTLLFGLTKKNGRFIAKNVRFVLQKCPGHVRRTKRTHFLGKCPLCPSCVSGKAAYRFNQRLTKKAANRQKGSETYAKCKRRGRSRLADRHAAGRRRRSALLACRQAVIKMPHEPTLPMQAILS